jgi:hypothetical protein
MDTEQPDMQESFDRIDADAVCEQCGTVNPPGTLLCKTCGNNLRDQRSNRLVEEAGVHAAREAVRPRRVLSALLAVFGILVVLWTALNVYYGNIDEWLVQGITAAQASESENPALYWSRGNRAEFEQLVQQLYNTPVTREETRMAMEAGQAIENYTGRYVIVRSAGAHTRTLGTACAVEREDGIVFVALVAGAQTEIRGRAIVKGAGTVEAKLVGIKTDDEIQDGLGFADVSEDGRLMCYGLVGNSSDYVEAEVYKVP